MKSHLGNRADHCSRKNNSKPTRQENKTWKPSYRKQTARYLPNHCAVSLQTAQLLQVL